MLTLFLDKAFQQATRTITQIADHRKMDELKCQSKCQLHTTNVSQCMCCRKETPGMPPRTNVDERIGRLRKIRDDGNLEQIREIAIKSMSDGSNLVVAEAAKIVADLELAGLENSLIAAWKRLAEHEDPVKADRCCTAKSAIIESLGKLGYDEPEFYLQAIQLKQIEPAWPRAEDTAENVRGGAAFAIARSQRTRPVDKLIVLVDLLQGTRLDRINAIRAITDTRCESAIPLLRLKLLSGDVESEVMGSVMTGLLDLDTNRSLPMVIKFLSHSDESLVLEAAAALGSCGKLEAVQALIATWNRTGEKEIRRSLLLSIGLSRDKSAIDFLIARIESADDAATALEALKPACVYEETRTRIRTAVEKNDDQNLKATFARMVGRTL